MTEEAPETTAPSRDVCKWAMLCHLSALTGLLGNGLGFLIGPLVVWLFKKEDDPFIDDQGKEAVNFQITMFIALAISALLMLVLIGFVLMIVVGIMMVVFPIIGALKANQGERYRYPVSFRFIS
ncbi:MAG: DUF4870 domain-containing protein [Fidelibacterota bacterium]|nr:MAG: DUF4870 domain-containing protein [Candidatus Neomarinimicrobiota bacterium]